MKKINSIEYISITNGSRFEKGNYTRVVYSEGSIEWYFEWLTVSELSKGISISLGTNTHSLELKYEQYLLSL